MPSAAAFAFKAANLDFPAPFERIPNQLIIILDKSPPLWYSSLDFGPQVFRWSGAAHLSSPPAACPDPKRGASPLRCRTKGQTKMPPARHRYRFHLVARRSEFDCA